MARTYPLPGLHRVSPRTRQGRPLCSCCVPQGSALLAYATCPRCRGTGGVYPEGTAPARPRLGHGANASLAGG